MRMFGIRRTGVRLCAILCGMILVSTGIPAWAQTTAAAPAASKLVQRISLDLKGVDILDVLKLLSQKSGLNFVAGHNVSGRVTIFVNDVDVWEAFELIIGANDLAYERRGDIVTVMTSRDYELIYGQRFQGRTEGAVRVLQYAKGVQVATVLNQVKSAVGRVVADETTDTLILNDVPGRLKEMLDLIEQLDRPTETRVYLLNYAEAEKLKEKVQELLSPIGTFTVDARTNKAVVTDLKETVEKVDRLVRAFDSADGEVLIDARIVKVELTDEMDLGIDWTQIFGHDLATRSNFRVLGDIVGGTATGGAIKLFTGPDDDIRIILEALKKITKTETLSNPRIMVSNNQEAKILVGTKEAVVTVTTTIPATGSTVSAPEIQYVDVGTKLFVTPSIKRDGHIQLKIRPEVSTAKIETFQTNRIPIVTSTEAETTVLAKTGTTVIIGGLIETKNDRTDSKVPFLGDLPWAGVLFRGSTDIKKKTELVVFLTPKIMLPDGSIFVPDEANLVRDPVTISGIPGDMKAANAAGLPVPASYHGVIRDELRERLSEKFQAGSLSEGAVMATFVLNRDGWILGEPELNSPQGDAFVHAAREALRQPFAPFPEESTAKEVRFRIVVEYAPVE
ncbi:MAG: hypothetical protein HYT88_01315 [Candidatus Omnitrophica bacterium]|nr:hypothetical protein [Candidatus Omnitrophota bacterium]MBI3009420.1 hypothetical protein [Candidatus Omnitrophota bacterium]